MDGKKIGIVVVIVLIIIGIFAFNGYQEQQLAKKQEVVKAKEKIKFQEEKDRALVKENELQQEKQRALALEKEQENKALELQAQQEKIEEENKISQLMNFKNMKHVFNFETDVAILKESQDIDSFFNKLDALSQRNLVKEIIINAYTDDTGSQSYNMKLSSQRAQALDIMLKDYKLQINRQENGENNPIASNATQDGRASNRRIEITIK